VHRDVQHARLAFDHLAASLPRGSLDVSRKGFPIK